ncbi:MAG: hypothetical protein ACE5IR_15035 [bacterium]
MFRVPAQRMGQGVIHRPRQRGEQIAQPGLVAGRLPGQIRGFHETILHVRFHRHAHPFFPVFVFGRIFGRLGEHVIENPSVGGLHVGKRFDGAFHIRLEIFSGAQHVGMIADPQRGTVGGAEAADVAAVDTEVDDIGFQKRLNLAAEALPFTRGGFNLQHGIAFYESGILRLQIR